MLDCLCVDALLPCRIKKKKQLSSVRGNGLRRFTISPAMNNAVSTLQFAWYGQSKASKS